MISELDYTC